MDYASLRQEGLRLLEQLTGGEWTDFNTHDPGITILEQLCYALTDLGYRTAYALPDILAEGGGDPYQSLHAPRQILTTNPVTLADLRRLVIDVDGVKNAWIERTSNDTLPLYYLPSQQELRLVTEDLRAQEVKLRGLCRVLIQPSGAIVDNQVRANVAARLHQNRGLCEDFAEITLLKAQPIQIEATVEIDPVDDPGALLGRITRQLYDELSPSVHFSTLGDLLLSGVPTEEIFAGPPLRRGFLTDQALEDATRRTVVHTSDLMRAIMNVPGVRAVSRIHIANGGPWEEWALAIDSDKVPELDIAGLRITLRRGGQAIAIDPPSLPPAATTDGGAAASDDAIRPPSGRNRNIGKYTSVQKHLPGLYGIGELGLPDSASDDRKAAARQLKAYLMFFDQLLASSFAQLAHTRDLFSFASGPQTYFTQALEQPGIGLDEICTIDDGHRSRLQDLVEGAASAAALERKNRFLNHLLARFAEPIGDHALSASLDERAGQKQQLLSDYPRASGARGTGANYLEVGAANQSGLQRRLQLLLGLSEARGETMLVVEHILLRPIAEDVLYDDQGQPLSPEPPLLSLVQRPDPFSLQLTFVLPDGAGRFAQPEFKRFVEQTLREQTPAHLSPYVCYLGSDDFTLFQMTYADWLGQRRDYIATTMSLPLEGANMATRAIDIRGARDRIIDLLGFGATHPLEDTDAEAESLTVNYDTPVAIDIDPTQINVRYELYDGTSPLVPPITIIGNGLRKTIIGPPITVDHTYQIRANKIDRPENNTFLIKKVTVKIGLNAALPASLPAVDPSSPIVDYGSQVEVHVDDTQSGVTYRLLDAAGNEISVAPVVGNAGTISLLTRPMLEDTIIRIKANRDFDPTEKRPALQVILDPRLPLAVRANPSLGVSFGATAPCDYGGRATLTLTGSQASVQYTAYVRSLVDADFVPTAPVDASILVVPIPGGGSVQVTSPPRPDGFVVQPGYAPSAQAFGNGGALALTLGPLQEDSVVVVQAHKDHGAVAPVTSDLQLQQPAVLFVRPALVPLSLQLSASADGKSGSLLVQNGQPGVFYHFRRGTETTEVGLPAYFHRLDDTDPTGTLNKGIEQLRLGTDWVVARDQPAPSDGSTPDLTTLPPQAPVVDISPLPTDGTLSVVATKARTGVSWSTSRTIPVTPSS